MKKHWFLPKLYGYGFVPITWQGWLATFVLLGVMILSAYTNNFFSSQVDSSDGFRFLLDTIIVTTLFSLIFKDKIKGGLQWRWGRKK